MRIAKHFSHGCGVHVVLALLAAVTLVQARMSYRDQAELERLLASGTSEQKAFALHIQANRGEPKFQKRHVAAMLMHEDARVRELMMTSNMMRLRKEPIRRAAMRRWSDEDSRTRAEFVLDFRIGNYKSMTLNDLRLFLQAGPADE